ncbi:MAG: tetratricopeptide repeat protein, partial [Luteolibacter sp.]
LKGQALELSGRLTEARSSIDEHIIRFPDHGRGYSSRARVLLKLGLQEEALADYRTALSKTPDAEPDLVQEAAMAMAAAGHDEEAIALLDSGLKRLGEIPSLMLKALEFEVKAGRFDSALSRAEAMKKSAPRPEPWMAKRAELLAQAGRNEESRSDWQALAVHLENLPNLERGSNSMSLLMEQAKNILAKGEKTDRRSIPVRVDALHEEEIQLMNQHLTATPDGASIWNQRSLLLLADGEFQQALLDCDEADRLAPGKFPTDYVRCQAFLASGDSEKARATLDEFLKTHPDHVHGLVTRARLELQSHQIETALADFRTALKSSGGKAEIDLIQEAAAALAANGCRDEAIETLDAQITSQGNIPALLARSLELDIAAGKFDAAISRVEDLAKNSPQPEPWMAKRAELLGQAGRTAEARAAWLALRSHLDSLPNLQRGQPSISALAQQTKAAISTSQPPIPVQ